MNANDKDLEKKKKDINSLDQIVTLATSLQHEALWDLPVFWLEFRRYR